jgi:hypothetical protein
MGSKIHARGLAYALVPMYNELMTNAPYKGDMMYRLRFVFVEDFSGAYPDEITDEKRLAAIWEKALWPTLQAAKDARAELELLDFYSVDRVEIVNEN